MTITRRTALILGTASLVARPALANRPGVYVEDGVAIDGTDAVAYFTEGKPVPGTTEHALDWQGARWLFSSADNRAKFAADPTAFAPEYGGYCAYAVSRGYVAPTVPEAWTIVDGKLYLNFSLSVRDRWSKDIPGNIAAADANWPQLHES